jgi:hypothetical protein
VQPGDLVGQISLGAPAENDLIVGNVRFSTAAASRVTLVVSNVASTATSTLSGTGRISWIDLT